MTPWHEIVAEIEARRKDRQPVLDDMQEVAARYRGDYVIPFPGADENNQLPPMAPALIADIIDHTAMNAASVLPQTICPAVDSGKATGRRSKMYARTRQRATKAWWHREGMRLHLRKVTRQLIGYGTFAMMVTPDFRTQSMRIEVRDPLSAFPEPRNHNDLRPPCNSGFIVGKSADWIRSRYPMAKELVKGQGEALWDVLEWVDENEIVFGILGPREERNRYASDMYTFPNMELARFENRMGTSGIICPNRVSLEDIASQVKNIIGQVDLLNRLMALDVIATEKLILPDRYIVGTSAMRPKINDNGQWNPGWTGKPNIILDASQIGVLPGQVDPQSRQMVDRVERNARISGGGLPQFGGETYGALRTGRGMDTLMGQSLEPRIMEIHDTLSHYLPYVNEAFFEGSKGYFGAKKFSMYTGNPGDDEVVEYTPNEHFEISLNSVSYPVPGANKQATTVELSQQLAAGAITMLDYRMRHPDITDPDAIERQSNIEAMQEAMRGMLLQGIAAGTLAVEDLIEAAKQIKQGKDIFDAMEAAQANAQARQAEMAAEAEANQIAAPETMPGMNPPGTGGEQPGPPQPEPMGPNDDQSGLFRLIGATKAGMNA